MARKKQEPNRVDELLDDLLEDCGVPSRIFGTIRPNEANQKRLVKCVLLGEFNHHFHCELPKGGYLK